MSVLIHPTLPIVLKSDGSVAIFSHRSNQVARWTQFTGFKKGTDDNRYFTVELNGKKLYVHQLMAETFIGPRPTNSVVDHINRNKGDNRIENLRYVSQGENIVNSDYYDSVLNTPESVKEARRQHAAEYKHQYYLDHKDKIKARAHDWYHSHKKNQEVA